MTRELRHDFQTPAILVCHHGFLNFTKKKPKLSKIIIIIIFLLLLLLLLFFFLIRYVLYRDVFELARGPYWVNIGLVLFLQVYGDPQARSINLQNRTRPIFFPVWTEQASSIKFLLLWLYFEFPDGIVHLISETRALLYEDKKLFLLRHFCRTSANRFGQTTRKRFLLNAKMIPFEYLFKNTNQ